MTNENQRQNRPDPSRNWENELTDEGEERGRSALHVHSRRFGCARRGSADSRSGCGDTVPCSRLFHPAEAQIEDGSWRHLSAGEGGAASAGDMISALQKAQEKRQSSR